MLIQKYMKRLKYKWEFNIFLFNNNIFIFNKILFIKATS